MVLDVDLSRKPVTTPKATHSKPKATHSKLRSSSSMGVLPNLANRQTVPGTIMQAERHLSGSMGTLHWLNKHHLMPISSCWLKSQSKTRPSQPTLTVLRHITPSAAATLKPSTSICASRQASVSHRPNHNFVNQGPCP